MHQKVALAIGSTRTGRFADHPCRWIKDRAKAFKMPIEVLDLNEFPMPFFNEQVPPTIGPVTSQAAAVWVRTMRRFDGYIILTPEYNRSIPGVLKNALDYLGGEVRRKPVAFVGYGGVGGAYAIQHLRSIVIELQMLPIRNAVHVTMEPYLAVSQGKAILNDFPHLNTSLDRLLEELAWWLEKLA
ncbi:NADPH-dependent FMN reductase [Nitratireductor soli]|uniref:NADPH-dependent FMN reductase n=1 Tax=Nitratireductor soli TaxID=1670619 RepID=UPI00065E6000|nr:NAD(P)H-dependent oxidoreductase [Nitratireductor soli]